MTLSRNIQILSENIHVYHVVINADFLCRQTHVKALLFILIFRVYTYVKINNYFINKFSKIWRKYYDTSVN